MTFDELDELFGPVTRRVDADGALTIAAPARSDIFVSPAGLPPALNGAALLTSTDGDFTLAATVHAQLHATFDAGALLLWRDDTSWAKLALERSPAGDATIVSVVTRGVSDDCNSLVLAEPSARLRIARTDAACAFHLWSGGRWELIRHFSLGPGPLAAGFLCQSPTGDGTEATFSEVELSAQTVEDVRSGA